MISSITCWLRDTHYCDFYVHFVVSWFCFAGGYFIKYKLSYFYNYLAQLFQMRYILFIIMSSNCDLSLDDHLFDQICHGLVTGL